MIDMNDFRYFVTIVDNGGFTAAGRIMDLPTSTLSVRIKQLEQQLGVTLLRRSSRQISLTEAGLEFYRHAVETVESANVAEIAMKSRLTDPAGVVRYTTATAIAQHAMPAMINSFLVNHPKISLVQHAVNHFVDIIAENYDVAIRAHGGDLPNSRLVQRPLAKVTWGLFAAPSYLIEKGEPIKPADLSRHQSLFFRREKGGLGWRLRHLPSGREQDVELSPRLAGACMDTIRIAAEDGLGIAALPFYVCKQQVECGKLKNVLPGWIAAETTITALMSTGRGMGAAVRAFVDHLAGSFPSAVK
ncbi:LysR substrate-binding domain-containing protein [Rhizobium sp. WYJ-E13]|uniref:LysR substrate-binding domain-containing protein n=1 Tax=Rhizobium sp. WYJ-E13 TaxID=2849093 RepID=UPI001C1F1E34|nr:LysR substrate-binding domain-containing protein [Rhizobium sp. WYJ-E13]QWW72568.1 LysR family transcriptional regulator [Rhizobium sp. WYJ-E13]